MNPISNSENLDFITKELSSHIFSFLNNVKGTESFIEDKKIKTNPITNKMNFQSGISVGFFSFEYYNNKFCNSSFVSAAGYATNTCLELYNLKNVAVGGMYGVCSGI